METEETPNLDSVDPEIRLSQFLFVGKEYPDYQPGNWFVHNYFVTENVPSIQELAENSDKHLIPIQLIQQAFESNLVPNPETLIFALAVCCRQMKSELLRQSAYSMVKKICINPQHFILFVKFASALSKQKEESTATGGKTGWGAGLRKAVNNWYLSKDALELAKCVTRYKGRYGWKHKDIIKLSHPRANETEKEVVLSYIIHGIQYTRKQFGEDNKFSRILEYIEHVETFKHTKNELEAAQLLETHALTLDHVPGHLLKSREVWNSLIPSMDLVTLLNNLQRIHNMSLYKPPKQVEPTTRKILDEFTNDEKIARDKVHPALLLITIRNYEHSGKPLSYERRKAKKLFQTCNVQLPKPDPRILKALYRMFHISFMHLPRTDLRYMITINTNKSMFENRAWRNGNINATEAACLLALVIRRAEKNVTVATFKDTGIDIVDLSRTASFDQAMRLLKQVTTGSVNLSHPLAWAANQDKPYDVFINLVEKVFDRSYLLSEKAFHAYKTKLKLPNAKLINCAIASSSSSHQKSSDKNILTINGFDASVPLVIEAFAKSLF